MARSSTQSRRKQSPTSPTLARMVDLLRGDAGGWCVLLLLALGLAIARPTMERASSATAPRPREVRFVHTPEWIGESLIEHLGRIATRHIGTDVPTQSQLINMHTALDQSGWFDTVRQVRRTAAGDIEILAVFLNPVAIVTDAHGDVLVDVHARPLPQGTRMGGDAHHLRITNPVQNRPARPRHAWPGDDVAAALRLHAVLSNREWLDQITSIDLSSFNHDGSLVLLTSQARIVWGSPPGEEIPLETLTDRKLMRLDKGFQSTGRIDQHYRGTLDLRDASHLVTR